MKILFCLTVFVALYFILWYFDWKEYDRKNNMDSSCQHSVGNHDSSIQELKFFCIKDKGYHVSVWPKVQGYKNVDFIEFSIAGISHYAFTAKKHLGESLAILSPEPDNPFDSNAIRILTAEWQLLGYVPRDMAKIIREHTTATCPCFIYIGYNSDEDVFYTDAYIKVSLSKL